MQQPFDGDDVIDLDNAVFVTTGISPVGLPETDRATFFIPGFAEHD